MNEEKLQTQAQEELNQKKVKSIIKAVLKHDNIIVNTMAVVGALLSIWGFVVAYKVSGVDYSILNSAYSTIRLFAFDLDAPDLQGDLIWQLEVARWMISFFMFYYIAKGIILLAKTEYEVFKLKLFGGDHIIICGAGEKGKTLGLDWLEENPDAKIFYIESDVNNPNIETLQEAGAIVIHGKGEEESILKKLQVQKAAYLITTTDSDATNMEIISKVTSLIGDRESKNGKLKCYIHLFHNEFYEFFKAKGFADSDKLDIKIFNINSNSARMLFGDKKHLLGSNVLDSAESIKSSDTKVKIAIFGFGKLGESILVHALHLGHFYNENPLEVTVVFDKDKDENRNLLDEFEKHYDILKEKYNGRYWNVKFIDDGDFKDENICEYSQIVIAYENEFESLSNLMKLLKKYNDEILSKNIDISIYSNSFASTAEIIQNDKDDKNHTVFKQVRTFGEINKTCSYDMVINQVLDKKAKKNHNQYEQLHNAVAEGWAKDWDNELEMFLKDSNRYLMEHNEIKKYMIKHLIDASNISNDYESIKKSISSKYFNYEGMGKINWDDMGLRDHEYALKLSEDEIVQLAKVEHNRWNAFHILNGWKKLEIPSDAKEKMKKDSVRKLHPCLVSWEELDYVSDNHKKNYKSDDIETIMRIPSLEKNI